MNEKRSRTAPDGQARTTNKVRFAVVGAGHIAQAAVLPAFRNAENAELTALLSSDPQKRETLGRRHSILHTAPYEEYDRLLQRGAVDAVYIALPNHLHCDYAVRAARAGVHVLCEKPMAVTEAECEQMIRAAEAANVHLMVAYRLHFETANLEAIEIAESGELGTPRFFESVFSQDVKEGDIRLAPLSKGGGSVYDLGVYCINAARYLFQDEPVEVAAFSESRPDSRFARCDEMTSAILRFPNNRLATFTASFGARAAATYRLVGTRGFLEMHNAYEYAQEMDYRVTADGDQRERRLPKRDQFGPQLVYFSECILKGRSPEPDGLEGLADVRIVEAIYRSAKRGRPERLEPVARRRRPRIEQRIERSGIQKPDEVHAAGPRAS